MPDLIMHDGPSRVTKAALEEVLEVEGGILDAMTANATYAARKGAGVGRFIERARAGENLKIACLGDSILEGQTVTTPATDGAMILLAADLSARFGVTVTQANHATSGFTAARLQINGNVSAAIAEKADLYIVSAMDKNDLGSDIYGNYAPGYPLAASNAGVERIIRAIRTEVPKADIIVMSTNPYVPASSSNAYQQVKDRAVKRLAAVYGCEWVDCYAAFAALGDWSALMADTTHPNTAGHRKIADTLLDHLENAPKVAIQPGAVAAFGLYNPEQVNPAKGDHGYVVNATPGATGLGVTYVTGGTGWAAEVTSTAGDYVEAVATATELQVQMSTSATDNTVVDVSVDGVVVASNVNLSATGGKQGNYWVPFALGLSAASHTLRLTLKSGTLRTYATAALVAPTAAGGVGTAESQVVTIADAPSTISTVPTDGTYVTMVDYQLALPAGWTSATVQLLAQTRPRIQGTTTTTRQFNGGLLVGSTTVDGPLLNGPAVAGAGEDYYPGDLKMQHAFSMTATTQIRLRVRLLSTDKTNCTTYGHKVQAVLTRTA